MNMVYLRDADIPSNPADPIPQDAKPTLSPDDCPVYYLDDPNVCQWRWQAICGGSGDERIGTGGLGGGVI